MWVITASSLIRELFRERYVGHPEELAGKLGGDQAIPFCLKQMCFGMNPTPGGGGKDPILNEVPSWCPALFQSLAQLMIASPNLKAKLIPQFALVLAHDKSPSFRRDLAEHLLGDVDGFLVQIHGQEIAGSRAFPALSILMTEADKAWRANLARSSGGHLVGR